MNNQRLNGPGPGLLTRLVAGVTGVIVLAGAFLVGLVAWIFLAGFLLIGGVVLSIWVWRQKRRFEKFAKQSAGDSADSGYIEGEFTVISENKEYQPNKRE